jgi:L-aminopeptidase/D-esterase-like protein
MPKTKKNIVKSKKSVDEWNKTNDLNPLPPSVSKGKQIKHKFKNIKVASVEYTDGVVGSTFIHFEKGARVYEEVTGGFANRVTCNNVSSDNTIFGLCLSGGSTLGLEATTGAIAELMRKQDYYLPLTNFQISGGIIFGSMTKNGNLYYADKDLGRFAVRNLKDNIIKIGQVGGGLGASHGQGAAYGEKNGIKFMCVVINNALGDIYKDNKIIKKNYSNISKNKKGNNKENTTLTAFIINIDLSVSQLKQMSNQLNNHIGKIINPFNTLVDGDMIYCCSTKEKKNNLSEDQMVELLDSFCCPIVDKAIYNSII